MSTKVAMVISCVIRSRQLARVAAGAVITLVLSILASFGWCSAAQTNAEDILSRLFESPENQAALFSKAFLDTVGGGIVHAQLADILARLGPLESVHTTSAGLALVFARGTLRAVAQLDADDKITGLVFSDETSDQDERALNRALSTTPVSANDFTAAFLADFPLAAFDSTKDALIAKEGVLVRIERRQYAYYAVFTKFENHVLVRTNSQGKVSFLQIQPPVARTASLDAAFEGLKATDGASSFIVLSGAHVLAEYQADRPLAVASAFKLAVLVALSRKIQQSQLDWATIETLRAADKSVPTGAFQDWPQGIPLTVATLAAQMISVSDNTAADALARVVGRSALEEISARNTPFLTTREVYTLQHSSVDRRAAYEHADLAQKRRFLAAVDEESAPRPDAIQSTVRSGDIEWFFSVRELCELMSQVQSLDLMTIAPGIAVGQWRRIAFKGGSDAGVLNFTSFVMAPSGEQYCISATWNDSGHPNRRSLSQGCLRRGAGTTV